MRNKLLILLLLISASASAWSAQTDSIFGLRAEAMIGYTNSSGGTNDAKREGGWSPRLRLIWEPNHRLNIGIEASQTHLYTIRQHDVDTEFGTTDFKSVTRAQSLLIVFNMKVWFLDIYSGAGAAHISSNIDAFSEHTRSGVWDNVFMFSMGWSYPLPYGLSLGLETHVYFFSQLESYTGGYNLKLSWVFLEW